MLNKLKTYLTLLSIIIAILAGSFGLIERASKLKAKNRADNAEIELRVKTSEVTTYQNKLGQTVTKTLEYERKIGDLEFSNDSLERSLYKSYKVSKIKEKQLRSMTKIVATGHNKKVIYFDTIRFIDSNQIVRIPIKTFNDSLISITCMQDTVEYDINLSLDVFTNARLVPRKFQPFRWINKKWELKKTINKNEVEVITNIPNSKVIIRQIKIWG